MTDIVERLREGLHDLDIETKLNPLLDEAADEIDRLREALTEAKDDATLFGRQMEKYIIALRKIAHTSHPASEIARAALGEGKE